MLIILFINLYNVALLSVLRVLEELSCLALKKRGLYPLRKYIVVFVRFNSSRLWTDIFRHIIV